MGAGHGASSDSRGQYVPTLRDPEQMIDDGRRTGNGALLTGAKVANKASLNSVVTPNVQQRWLQAAQNLSFAQDMIIMRGPSFFVRRCLDSNIPDEEAMDNYPVMKYAWAFLFIVVFPFAMPGMFLQLFMTQSWGWDKVGQQRIQWSREHRFFKIFQDNDDFMADNARIDVGKLRLALSNSTEESVGNVIYLTQQDFQSQLSLLETQMIIGAVTLLVTLIVSWTRHNCKGSYWLKMFTFNILHFQWFSDSFKKLKYSSATLFGKSVKLYKVIPCVWFSIIVSFIVVIPICVFVFDQDAGSDVQVFLNWERWMIVVRIVPSCCLAAYIIGNFYMQMANATFSRWLSTTLEYSVVERQFEQELNGLFQKLISHVEYFAVTSDEIEVLANSRSIEMWMNYYTLRTMMKNTGEFITEKRMKACKKHMSHGEWAEANHSLADMMSDLKKEKVARGDAEDFSLKEGRQKRMMSHLITNIYIVDTKSDISFWVDLKTGTCERASGDEGRYY